MLSPNNFCLLFLKTYNIIYLIEFKEMRPNYEKDVFCFSSHPTVSFWL